MAEALLQDGYLLTYDLSLPLEYFYSIVTIMESKLKDTTYIRCSGIGHLGDGNLHLNITSKEFDHELHNLIEPYVFEWTSDLKGSVSAEHGIGFKKTKFIHYSKSHSAISLMKQIKQIMDPKGIMNPYKVLPK